MGIKENLKLAFFLGIKPFDAILVLIVLFDENKGETLDTMNVGKEAAGEN